MHVFREKRFQVDGKVYTREKQLHLIDKRSTFCLDYTVVVANTSDLR